VVSASLRLCGESSFNSVQVHVAFGARAEALDALEDLHLGTVHLADAVVARLDLLGGEVRAVGEEGDLARHAVAGRAVELDGDALADVHVREVGHRDVDLHVLIGGIEQRQQRRAGLGQLARPDELRLDARRHRWRLNRGLVVRHAELVELALGELALLAQHLELMASDGDGALLGLGAGEHVAGAVAGAGRLVAPRLRFVEELLGAGAGADEGAFARQGRLGQRDRGGRLAQLRLPRADVLRPHVLGGRDLLLLAADLRIHHLQRLLAGGDAGGDVAIVEADEDGVGRDRVALAERDLEHASRDLAADDALLALDDAGVVRRAAVAAPHQHGGHGGDGEHGSDD
jgi:hypothetical protein